MTKQEIREMLGRQMQRLEDAARTHDHPRVQTCVSREMTAIARLLLELDRPDGQGTEGGGPV